MSLVKFINENNLRIARENIGLDTSDASKQISTSKKDLVSEWEKGRLLPTWTQIKKTFKSLQCFRTNFFL